MNELATLMSSMHKYMHWEKRVHDKSEACLNDPTVNRARDVSNESVHMETKSKFLGSMWMPSMIISTLLTILQRL